MLTASKTRMDVHNGALHGLAKQAIAVNKASVPKSAIIFAPREAVNVLEMGSVFAKKTMLVASLGVLQLSVQQSKFVLVANVQPLAPINAVAVKFVVRAMEFRPAQKTTTVVSTGHFPSLVPHNNNAKKGAVLPPVPIHAPVDNSAVQGHKSKCAPKLPMVVWNGVHCSPARQDKPVQESDNA